MLTIKIKLQSTSDIITNSSSELYVIKDDRNREDLRDVLKVILKGIDFSLRAKGDPDGYDIEDEFEDYDYIVRVDDCDLEDQDKYNLNSKLNVIGVTCW